MQTTPVTTAQTSLGTPTASAISCFVVIVIITLIITYWAARRTRSAKEFYAAGRSVSALQNGLALSGDYMSAASFLGIAGLVALKGYDGMIYATGWLVGWPALMFLVAEPLRNLGKYTFADVVAFRLKQRPVRIASAIGGILTVLFYTIAQMVGSGNLIKLMFGISYETAVIVVAVRTRLPTASSGVRRHRSVSENKASELMIAARSCLSWASRSGGRRRGPAIGSSAWLIRPNRMPGRWAASSGRVMVAEIIARTAPW